MPEEECGKICQTERHRLNGGSFGGFRLVPLAAGHKVPRYSPWGSIWHGTRECRLRECLSAELSRGRGVSAAIQCGRTPRLCSYINAKMWVLSIFEQFVCGAAESQGTSASPRRLQAARLVAQGSEWPCAGSGHSTLNLSPLLPNRLRVSLLPVLVPPVARTTPWSPKIGVPRSGAAGGTRTLTKLPPLAPEASASANSATAACIRS